jgi:hypothetical protein
MGVVYRPEKTPDSSTKALWLSHKQTHIVTKQDELAKKMVNLTYEIFVSYFEGFFNMP